VRDRHDELELLRRNRRIRATDERQLDWANLTALTHERLAFVYPRLSTHEQRDRSVWSIERQRWLEELARHDGYEAPLSREEIDAIRTSSGYQGWYQNGQVLVDERDLGISGTLGRHRRGALDHLIDLVDADRVESIYTVEVSRLWRDKSLTGDQSLRAREPAERSIDVDDALRFGRLCKERNVILVMPHMRLNLNDRMHWRIYRTEAERAAEELEMMQYRLGGARAMKARQGFHAGGPNVPVGFVLDTNEESPTYQKLVPYAPHAEVVGQIFAQFVACGGSFSEVVGWCRSRGVRLAPVPADLLKAMKGRWALSRRQPDPEGWPVTLHLVYSVVTNPKYIGWWVYKGEVVSRDNHPPIVDEVVFWEAAALVGAGQPRRRGKAAAFPPALLAGLLHCCNHEGEPRPLSSSGGRGHQWYSCHRDYRNGHGDHHCLSVTTYILERPITEFVTSQCSYPDQAATVLQHLETEHEQHRAEAAARHRRRRSLEQEIAALQANCRALLSSAQYTPQRHADLEDAIAEKQRQLRDRDGAGRARRPALTADDVRRVRRFLADIGTEWPRLSPELHREFLTRIALDRIYIRHDRERIWCQLIWRTGRVQEIVIHRPFVDERTRWTAEEEETLRKHFYNAPAAHLLQRLPKRTWTGIERHARALGLERKREPNGGAGVAKRHWDEWELELLRRYYEATVTKDELKAALPHRRWDTIKAKAHRMGLRWVRREPWESRLRWEEVAAGTFDRARDVTTMLPHEGLSRQCRSRSWSRSPSPPSAGSLCRTCRRPRPAPRPPPARCGRCARRRLPTARRRERPAAPDPAGRCSRPPPPKGRAAATHAAGPTAAAG